MIIIREATKEDYEAVWDIFHEVIQTEDTYVFDANTPKEDLKKHWFASYMHSFVAVENDEVIGTYILKPNQPGRGSHIANASYMVKGSARGKGIGGLLCQHSLETAKKLNFHAVQFNIVVSTNEAAVSLWKKYGFQIIGTLPEAFNHCKQGLVDAYVMYRKL